MASALDPGADRSAARPIPTSDDLDVDTVDWSRAMRFGLPGSDTDPVGTGEPRPRSLDSDLIGSPVGASASAAAAVLSGITFLGLATTLATVVAPATRPRSRRHLLRLERPD